MFNLSVLITFAFLSVIVIGLPNIQSIEKKPGYCHGYGVDIKEGEAVPAPIGICGSVGCSNATENDYGIMYCGLIAQQKGCKLQLEDATKQYPDCCARYICE